MPSKNKPLSDAELEIYEEGRDLVADILQSIKEMKAGQTKPIGAAKTLLAGHTESQGDQGLLEPR